MFRPRTAVPRSRVVLRLLALLAVLLGITAGPVHTAQAAPTFKVIAFYDGTYDAAHISFVNEAKSWFPQTASQYGFSFTATNDWSQLNTTNLANYQVVMFLDNYPHTASQQTAFQTYMTNGGGFLGFHVSAFNSDSSDWPWYHNTFLGTGTFKNNTWGPTSETLKIDDPNHAATAGLPTTITSSVSEWYSWNNNLRANPAIDVLASIDQSSFPVGTDPSQSWTSGDYPIVWTNKNYKMIYANFGHNAMDYSTNTTLSSTFASAQQNQLLIQGLLWLGGQTGPVTPPTTKTGPIHSAFANKCVDVAGASSTNGTAVQLYDCNGTTAQNWTVASNGSLQSLGKCMDVTSAGTANGTKVQLYDCNGTASQVWTKSGNTLVNPQSGKCLDVTGNTSANGTRLQIWTCGTGTNQQWTLPS